MGISNSKILKIIRMNESELIRLIGKILKESYDNLDEVNDDVYGYVIDHPEGRFIMSHEDEINFRDMSDKQDVDHKPEGLWYAIGDEWIDWVRTEMPEWEYDNVFVLEINEDRVKKLSSYEDIEEFTKQYGRKDFGFMMIDWKKVAEKYSGIEIAPYDYEARMKFNWYYTWDVASGCIWNKEGIKSVKRVKI
jgi:hypothetical protein